MTTSTLQIPGFQGVLISPNHHDYDDARAVWNGKVDRRPRLIARCSGTADVAAAVRDPLSASTLIAVAPPPMATPPHRVPAAPHVPEGAVPRVK